MYFNLPPKVKKIDNVKVIILGGFQNVVFSLSESSPRLSKKLFRINQRYFRFSFIRKIWKTYWLIDAVNNLILEDICSLICQIVKI